MNFTKKIIIQEIFPQLQKAYQTPQFFQILEGQVLSQKVKFPLLEHLGELFFKNLPEEEHFALCDQIMALDQMGGNVIVATILRLRLPDRLELCLEKTKEYLIQGDEWYVCDIISERVPGNGLLQDFDRTFDILKKEFIPHENGWIRRSTGVAAHLALKWGLSPENAERYFDWAITLGDSKDEYIQKGVGWSAKTVARFHSEMVRSKRVLENPNIRNWMKRKIEMGLAKPRTLKQ